MKCSFLGSWGWVALMTNLEAFQDAKVGNWW